MPDIHFFFNGDTSADEILKITHFINCASHFIIIIYKALSTYDKHSLARCGMICVRNENKKVSKVIRRINLKSEMHRDYLIYDPI